eukprot:8098386-Alexandrium_andersonii.AAC.1
MLSLARLLARSLASAFIDARMRSTPDVSTLSRATATQCVHVRVTCARQHCPRAHMSTSRMKALNTHY